ncbi:MAG: glycosyltransferase family 2 protein [Candidatus Roizmanbacteria bacterium]|nr:glycosyltransferase family 2 protein [Candidatus Roizmanbacteria bacterium]
MKKKISIVIPCFNEDANIETTYKKIEQVLKKLSPYDFEYIIIDNGSTDKTKNIIKKLIKKDKRISGVFLSRNFGAEASATACYTYATGDAVIGIAADMQDPPELIPQFIKKWEQGNDIIFGIYTKAEDNVFITLLRKLFYKIFKSISNIDVPVNATGFGLVSRKAVDAFLSLPEKFRFSRGLLAWVGFKRDYIYYKKNKRERGKSSYNIFDYLHHSERGIFGFSYLVLDFMIYGGMAVVLLSFLFIIGYLYTVIVVGNPIKASIPTMLVIVFFGGIQLLAISIIGKYIQVIVEETKNRPMYIVEETINVNEKKNK